MGTKKPIFDNEQLIYGALCGLAARISHFFPGSKGTWHAQAPMIYFTVGSLYWIEARASEPIMAKTRGKKGIILHLLNSAQQILSEMECGITYPEEDEDVTQWLTQVRSRILLETGGTRKAADAVEFRKSRPPERLTTMIDLLPLPPAGTLTLLGGMPGTGKTNALMRLVYDWAKTLGSKGQVHVFTTDMKVGAWLERFTQRFGCVPFGSTIDGRMKAKEWLDGLPVGTGLNWPLAVADSPAPANNASELATLKRVAMEKSLTIVCSHQIPRTAKNTWFKGKGMEVTDSLISVLPDGTFTVHKNRSTRAKVFRAPLPLPGEC